jgi:hypothetical protein
VPQLPTQSKGNPPRASTASDKNEPASDESKSRDPSFAVVPGPFYNPNIGLGINVLPMMMFYPSRPTIPRTRRSSRASALAPTGAESPI